jgi:thiamine biosynthesis lipoprotein
MNTHSEIGTGRGRQSIRASQLIGAAVVTVSLLWYISITKVQAEERFGFQEPHLGTLVDITLYAPDETVANESARAAFSRIQELNSILSDYDPNSEVMRLCQAAGSGKPVRVSRELFEVLEKSLEISKATDGAFDVSIGPIVKLWRIARRQKKLPPADQLAAARQLVDWRQIILNASERTVELRKAGMLLDFGGIAKGYIADQARAVLATRGIKQSLVAIAGDISAGDPPPGRDGWRIGIAPLDRPDGEPSRYLRLVNCSVSTAGDAFQFVEIAGVRYSHIVDPATGLGMTGRISVTVVAPHGVAADGLDTAVCLIGADRGLKLIEQSKGAAALIVEAGIDGQKVTESVRLSEYVAIPGK